MMTAALKGISGLDKARHLLEEHIAPPYLPLSFFVVVDEDNILEMFLVSPFASLSAWNIS